LNAKHSGQSDFAKPSYIEPFYFIVRLPMDFPLHWFFWLQVEQDVEAEKSVNNNLQVAWSHKFNSMGVPNPDNRTYEHGFIQNNELP